jgi:iron-sulfur cluster assembly accessory protein
MINLTEKAILKIKEISEDEGIGHYSVRVKLKGGGCSGYIQDMYYDNVPTEKDEVFKIDDVQIICDEVSLQYMDECTIDYSDVMINSGFKFLNAKAVNSCGCGKSVGF